MNVRDTLSHGDRYIYIYIPIVCQCQSKKKLLGGQEATFKKEPLNLTLR